jgi:SAM-dependent methyltransferase
MTTPNTTPTDEKAFYDDIWLAWRDMQRYAPAPRYLRRMVMKELKRLSFTSVCDVGCGEGTLLSMIAERYPSVTLGGCEFSATALQSARELLPQAKLFSLDLLKDDVSGIEYDLLLSVQVLEHLSDDLGALERMRKMCKGTLIVSVPGGQLDDRGRRNGHYRHYTRSGLVEKMERTGFRVTRSFTCGWPVHSLFYRQLLRRLPQDAVDNVGLGGYDSRKRMIMKVADWAYHLNLSFVGTEVFAIGEPA